MKRAAYSVGRIAAALSVATLVAACSSPEVSDSLYQDSEVGSSKQVVRCRVLEVREVAIRSDEAGDKGELFGVIVGSVIGIVLGDQIGGGAGREIAIDFGQASGAVLGGGAGRQAAEKMSERPGLEYSIILVDGEELTLVQDFLEDDRIVQPGETCRMQIAAGGKNRVLPAEHLPDAIEAPKTTAVVN